MYIPFTSCIVTMRGSATNSFAAGATEGMVSNKVALMKKVSFLSRAKLSVGMEKSNLSESVITCPFKSMKL